MVKEFTVYRSTWLRGGLDSALLYLGKRCCLGFYGQACGILDSEMNDVTSFCCLISSIEKIDRIFLDSDVCNILDSEWATDLMSVNDAQIGAAFAFRGNDKVLNAESERESLLTDLFAEHGITVHLED